MSKNLKSLVCCILALLFVSGTIIAVFADSNGFDEKSESFSATEIGTEEETSDADVFNKLGDVNFDGGISAADARLALRIAAKLDVPSAEEFIGANVIVDNVVNAADARLILRVAAKLELESAFGYVTPEVESGSDKG